MNQTNGNTPGQPLVADDHMRQVRLGDWKIMSVLGAGAQGTVYYVSNLRTGRVGAAKVLKPEFSGGDMAARFLHREAGALQKLGALQDRHILRFLDSGEVDGLLYYVMEFVPGETLTARLAGPPLSLPEVLRVASEAAYGLAAAHQLGIVHRDFKPDNILICVGADGKLEVKIIDFGVARFLEPEQGGPVTVGAVVFGTPAYMPPEQAEGQRVGRRADLYALGVILYQMLAGGELPYRPTSPLDVVVKHRSQPPPELNTVCPGLPQGLATLVHQLMATDPKDRPESMEVVAAELDRLASGLMLDAEAMAPPRRASPRAIPIARPDQPWPRQTAVVATTKGGGSKLPLVIAGVLILALIGGAAAFFLRGDGQAPVNPAPTAAEVRPGRPDNFNPPPVEIEREKKKKKGGKKK